MRSQAKVGLLVPMVALTRDMNRAELWEMLRNYTDVGITDVMFYPRSGCELEYMSEPFLALCENFVEIAASLGLSVWLYDEFNWPSGTAGGMVQRDRPEYAVHYAIVQNGKIVMKKNAAYADILNPEVTERFLSLTHEAYYRRLGKWFGTTVRGIFTDEPSFRYYVPFPGGISVPKNYEEIYRAETGRDLFSDILAPTADFYERHYRLLGKLFRENFLSRIDAWCREHGILFTGHLMEETDMNTAVRANGGTIAALRCMGQPGVDEIFTNTDNPEWLTLGSLEAAVRGGKDGLVELFALGPADLPPAREVQMITLTAAFGATRYFLAVASADARGNLIKNKYFNPMNYMQPWFPGFRELGDAARKAAEYAKGEIAVEVCVRVPYLLAARGFADPAKHGVARDRMAALLGRLSALGLQWILLDEGEKAPDGIPVLTVRDDSCDTDEESEEIIASLCRARRVTVTEADGSPASRVFLRIYRDGRILLLDLFDSDEGRRLLVTRDGKTFPVFLPGRGHIELGGTIPPILPAPAKIQPVFSLSLDRPNLLRCNLSHDRVFRFLVTEPVTVGFCLREFAKGGTLTLDGRELSTTDTPVPLSRGIRELYLATSPVLLPVGEHTVSIDAFAESESFLPSCLIYGNFSAAFRDGIDILSSLPATVPSSRLDLSILPQYVGKITLSATVSVPAGATSLLLDACGLYTEVTLGGIPLGGKISGYEYPIPAGLSGDLPLVITEYTSVGPMFGREADAFLPPTQGWAPPGTFPGRYEKCGVLWVGFR